MLGFAAVLKGVRVTRNLDNGVWRSTPESGVSCVLLSGLPFGLSEALQCTRDYTLAYCDVKLQTGPPCLPYVSAAGIGAGFYLGYSWLPSFFTKHAGIPQSLTLWMVLSGMVIFTFVVPVSRMSCAGTCTTLYGKCCTPPDFSP
jgi:hypothetical protein